MSEFFEFGFVLGRDRRTGVDVEAGVFPGVEDLDAFGREEFEVHEELEDVGAEEFFERFEREFGQRVEGAVAGEESIGDEGVNMGMEVEVFAKGVQGEDDGGVEGIEPPPHPVPLPRWERGRSGGTEVFGEALVGEGAEAFEQAAVTPEIGAEHFGDGQDVMAVRHGSEDASGEEGGGGLDVFLVAGGTEPAAFAGEGEQVFLPAMIAADPGEATIEVAAFEEFVDDLRDDGAQGAKAGLVFLRVEFDERGEVAVDALPEGRLSRVAGAVEVHGPQVESWKMHPQGTQRRALLATTPWFCLRHGWRGRGTELVAMSVWPRPRQIARS